MVSDEDLEDLDLCLEMNLIEAMMIRSMFAFPVGDSTISDYGWQKYAPSIVKMRLAQCL